MTYPPRARPSAGAVTPPCGDRVLRGPSDVGLAFSDASAQQRPLCVDLDGTLVTTDSLWEGVALLFRQRPWVLLVAPLWLFGGRARFKRAVAKHVRLDPATLPYRSELLDSLRVARQGGRQIVLATAADRSVAEAVAQHLDLFDAIHASDGELNLKATTKRDRLQAAYPTSGFDYVGDSAADLPVLEAAVQGYLVGTSRGAARRAQHSGKVMIVSYRPSVVQALIRQLRPHQWAKNALVLLPVLLAPGIPTPTMMARSCCALVTLSLCASAGYVLNDLLDLAADREHPTKRHRPFASGALPVILGPPLFLGLLAVSFGSAVVLLSTGFTVMLALYLIGTLSYSLYFKRRVLVDVLVLAGLYAHRVLAGGIAAEVPVSAWLLGFSMFLFTSLAFAKRYVELRPLGHGDEIKHRGYLRADLEPVTVMGTTSGYLAALVFMLYVDSDAMRVSYREPTFLWLVLPVMLYWLSRVWLLAGRGQMQDDPVKFALKDKHSLACGVVVAALVVLARFTPNWLAGALH
ncbi:UbiA family prenyltransferase [Myxococcota bacterium]